MYHGILLCGGRSGVAGRNIMRPGGRYVATAWNLGLSNEDIETKTITELDIVDKSYSLVRQNSIDFVHKIKQNK